jgi:hypothetical protein
MGRHFWVGCGCFSWGDGGKKKATGYVSAGSATGRHTLSNSPIYVIYYMLSSGGFAAACLQVITKGVLDPRYPGQHTCVVQTSTTRRPVPMVFYTHSVCVTCYFCYMFSLGSSSGSSDSVRIYRRVIFGEQNWCVNTMYLIYIGAW